MCVLALSFDSNELLQGTNEHGIKFRTPHDELTICVSERKYQVCYSRGTSTTTGQHITEIESAAFMQIVHEKQGKQHNAAIIDAGVHELDM